MRERNRALAILLEMNDLLSSSLGGEEVWKEALSRILEWFELSSGRIYWMDENEEFLYLVAYQGIEIEGLEKIRVTEGFSGKAVQTRSFIAQHVMELEDTQRAELLASKGLKIIICVPLIAMGKVLGVMNLAVDKIIEIDQTDIDLLIALGNQLASAANNARLYEALEAKVAALKVQKEAIEFFAYSISHDLKSPAIGIYGLTKRLHKQYCEMLGGTGKLYCEQILKASEQILRLVDRINAFIMAKEAPLRFEKFEIKEVTEIIRDEFTEVLNKRKVKWYESDMLPSMVADRLSIIRVLRNLVDNALKYGGELLSEIRIEHRDEGEHHILSVYDDGVPLKTDDAQSTEALFQIFQRHKTSRGIEGTGLGLATVKEIAKRHHGKVWIESGTDKGTTFYVSFAKKNGKE